MLKEQSEEMKDTGFHRCLFYCIDLTRDYYFITVIHYDTAHPLLHLV